jgi:hypothetical protein
MPSAATQKKKSAEHESNEVASHIGIKNPHLSRLDLELFRPAAEGNVWVIDASVVLPSIGLNIRPQRLPVSTSSLLCNETRDATFACGIWTPPLNFR